MNTFKSKTMIQAIVASTVTMALIFSQRPAVYAGLPPRPTLDQPAAAVPTDPGGYIVLTGFAAPVYTEVEWRGLTDDWYVVEGWRTETATDQVKWFVRESDFRKGPFRWRVYDRNGGRLLGTSQPFMLPAFRGDLVEVKFLA